MKTTVIITQMRSEKTDHGVDIHLVFHTVTMMVVMILMVFIICPCDGRNRQCQSPRGCIP